MKDVGIRKFYLRSPLYDQSRVELVKALHDKELIDDDEKEDFDVVIDRVIGGKTET